MLGNNDKIVLLPGQLVVTDRKEIVWTLLGSCLSIVFYSPRKKLSGVCHAQLPKESLNAKCTDSCPSPCGLEEKNDYKFVTCSFKYMLNEFKKAGIGPHEIIVSVYGGAHMLNLNDKLPRIGDMNVEIAKRLLKKNNMKVKTEDIGGVVSRVISHFTETGITNVKLGNKISE